MKFGEFGRGPTTPVRGLTITMVVNHLLIGRIFQVIHFRWWISKTWTPPERNTDYFGMFSCLSLTCNLEKVCPFSSLGAPFREKISTFPRPCWVATKLLRGLGGFFLSDWELDCWRDVFSIAIFSNHVNLGRVTVNRMEGLQEIYKKNTVIES